MTRSPLPMVALAGLLTLGACSSPDEDPAAGAPASPPAPTQPTTPVPSPLAADPSVVGPFSVAGMDRADPLTSEAGAVPVRSLEIGSAQVVAGSGVRGPALGVLPDGRVLLGGGTSGRDLLLADPATGQVQTLGSIIDADQRRDDPRFAPTDIEVMAVSDDRVRLFVSYPEWVEDCVRLAVDRVDISTGAAPEVLDTDDVFRSAPCVPPANIQHASGRLVGIDAASAYVTIGDLGSPLIADRDERGQLGTVQVISLDAEPEQISRGHRNGQGLVLDAQGRLWETEHGPQGGDELNLIEPGRDYGWPFVTLGQPYTGNDYVMPERTGTHAGYTAPVTSWVPSVATSEVVQVPASWAGWQADGDGDLLMGTLADESFWRIRVSSDADSATRERLPVGHRIRDVDVRADGSVAATTDDGLLLILQAPS